MRYQLESKQLAFNTKAMVDLHFIFRLGIHLNFPFFLNLELKEILIFSARIKAFPRTKTSHNITELKA